MAWTIHIEAEREFDTLRQRGATQAQDLFAVVSTIDQTSKHIDTTQSNRPAFFHLETAGSCAGLCVFKVGHVVGCCDLPDPGSGAGDRFPMWLLALGEIGHDGTQADICARAQGRKP